MKVTLTVEDLQNFEKGIADDFLAKKIRAPVHLYGGGEAKLIEIFQKHVDQADWMLGGWRMHPHCLLKGVPAEELRKAIYDGKSISLSFPKHNILCSGIVGGVPPIAVGLAMALAKKKSTQKVVVFMGDMTAETGIAYESIKYSINCRLPILWVIEDNGLSVSSSTLDAWGGTCGMMTDPEEPKIIRYQYTPTLPHVGIGKFVEF